MFELTVSKSTLGDVIEDVDVLVDECKIHFTEDGMSIRAVDPANVGMVDTSLQKAAFESYEAAGTTIGVNTGRLRDIISMAQSDSLINISLNEETRTLLIKFDGLSYTLGLIDPDSIRQEPDIPDLDLPAEIILEGNQLSRGISAADMVSDHIEFSVDESEETFHIAAEGDTDDVDLKLDSEDVINLTPGPAESLFSNDYLKMINKAIPKSAEVTISVGESFPIDLKFEYAEGLGTTQYVLAPRIQSD